MYLKIHDNPGGKVVAVCDKSLIGKVLSDEKTHMDLDSYRGFYMGEEADEKKVAKALEGFGSANIVGKQAVAIALKIGLVEKADVMYINMIPYIQLYKI